MILEGDCIEQMRQMDEASVDAIVTDPPYGLEFMGKEWDRLGAGIETVAEGMDKSHPFRDGGQRVRYGATAKQMQQWHQAWATEALRVLKPGGHLLAAGGTRTFHRLVAAIEDAGFEIRDCIAHMYGSGFPKSHNLTGDWEGFGTALKPAFEPWTLARKPLIGTVASNCLEHGTGALNIDGCRIGTEQAWRYPNGPKGNTEYSTIYGGGDGLPRMEEPREGPIGRWPANVALSHLPECEEVCVPDCPVAMLDEQSGEREVSGSARLGKVSDVVSEDSLFGRRTSSLAPNDSGGASRFFYCAKASRGERNAGLDGFEEKERNKEGGRYSGGAISGRTQVDGEWVNTENPRQARANNHPTVKPIDLMRWLVRLVTPPGGTVLDPFVGSGTTGCACVLEGFDFIGIEREPEYVEIARARIAFWEPHAGREIEDVLVEAGLSERLQREHQEAGQLGLMDDAS